MPREELPQDSPPKGPASHPAHRLPSEGPAAASADRAQAVALSSGRPRIIALDVLRGFTLCEILLANIQLIANGGTAVAAQPMGNWDPWLGLPIFSLLFGIGFSLLLDSAANRVLRPRLVLLRRLLALLAIGLVHMLLWPGEVLTKYAIVGMLVLLPSSWLPRWAVAGLSAALVTVAMIGGGGPLLIAGLFLLGSALVRYGVIELIEQSTRGPVLLGLVFTAGLASALWVQASMRAVGATTQLPFTSTLADLLLAGVYVCVVLILLRTPLRPALQFVFARWADDTDQLSDRHAPRSGGQSPPRPADRPIAVGGVPGRGNHSHGPVAVVHPLASPLPPGPRRVALALGHLGPPPAPQPGQDLMNSVVRAGHRGCVMAGYRPGPGPGAGGFICWDDSLILERSVRRQSDAGHGIEPAVSTIADGANRAFGR